MALQSLHVGALLVFPYIGAEGIVALPTSQQVADAVGESTSYIGAIRWEDELSHTVSSAGGKIYWIPNAATFGAGSTYRIGIQNVNLTTGLETGTFDVYKDLVGGTDTITAAVINTAVMATGTKTLAHNALIAVSLELIAHGGTDSVAPRRVNITSGFPYCTLDTGTGPVVNQTLPYCVIEADDGALGILGPAFTIPHVAANTSFNSSSAVDEYAMIFQVPVKMAINRLMGIIGELDAGETGNLKLYTDPLGTPVAVRTVALVPETYAHRSSGTSHAMVLIAEYTLEPNTTYAIAYEATSTGNRELRRVTAIPSANCRKFTMFGTTLRGGTRADGTGAFTPSDTDWPVLGFAINKLDDGAGPATPRSRPLRREIA